MTSSQIEPPPARQRIAKLMARVGLCSRRDAEAWIVEGRVSVNGDVLTSPAHDVGPDDAILVDGAPLPAAQKTRLFMFHKPRGLVTSDRDPEGRNTVADFLRANWPDGPRVVTIGRLDINTEGLLLLTNDGGLARLLELPKTGWVRRYRVRAKGETDQAVLDTLRDGVSIDGIDYAGIEATLDRSQGANVWLTMGLREGKNREVKRVLEHIGLEVNRLIRLSFGPFQLGDLAEGAVEEVRTRVLRDQLGAALAAAAGVAFEDAAAPPQAKPAHGDRKPGRGGDKPAHRDDKPRKAGAERVNKGERAGRGGERPLRRSRESEPLAPPPIRERPVAGTRKHVSTLRAEGSEAARSGPRRRIERSDVIDRHDRNVTVERRVATGPAARLAPTRARDGQRPERRDRDSAPAHRQASPSALAKRARTARSGGYGTDRDDAAPQRERPARARPDDERKSADKRPRRVAPEGARPARAGSAGRGPNRERPNREMSDGKRPRGNRPRAGVDRMPAHEGGQTRADARPARVQGDRPARGTGRGETRSATGGAPRVGRPAGGDRRREAGARSERPTGDRPGGARPHRGKPRREEAGRTAPGSDRPRGKRFGGERSAAGAERAPRGEGRAGGAGLAKAKPSRDGDRIARARATRRPDDARAKNARAESAHGEHRGAQRNPRSGGGRPPAGGRRGGEPKGAPRGGPSRGKPRPKS